MAATALCWTCPTREESARTDSLSSALSRVRLPSSYAGSESHSKETRGTLAHATNLFSTVRCRLHIGSHMGVLDLRWYSTLRIGEEPSPLGRAEPYLMAACPWPRTAHSRQGRRRGAPGRAVCRAWVSGNTRCFHTYSSWRGRHDRLSTIEILVLVTKVAPHRHHKR